MRRRPNAAAPLPFPSLAPYVLKTSTVEVIRFDDPAFGAVADGVVNADGSTNYLAATDNSAALLAALTASVTLKRKLFIPAGNWMFRTPIAFTGASNLWVVGEGEASNILYVNPGNLTGLRIGSGTSGVNLVFPQNSVLSLAAEANPESRRVKVATTAPGETATQRFFKGMHIFFSDASQPLIYRQSTATVSQYLASFAVVYRVVDDDYIELDGSPEFMFNPGTKIGYWHNPVVNVHIEHLQFGNDLAVSWRSGGSAIVAVAGTIDPKMYDLTFSRPTSRGLLLTRTKGFDIDLIRSREVARDTQEFNGHNADGTLMSVGDQSGHGEIRRVYTQGGVHGVDFLGGKEAPALHSKITSVTARDSGDSVIGSHTAARFLNFSDIDISCNAREWGANGPEESNAPILMRGFDMTVTNAVVTGSPLAFRSHASSGHTWRNCKSYDCGRGLLIGEASHVNVRDMEHVNAKFIGIDIQQSYGPNQGLDYARNLQFDDVRSTGTPPPLGDVSVLLGGAYQMNRLKEFGWSFERFSRNGNAPVFKSNGTFLPVFPLFAASVSANLVDSLVGPAYSVAPTTSAMSALVASVAATTSTYQGGDQYPLVGGTATLSNPTLLNIETITLKSIALDYAGLGHAPGDVLTLEGGDYVDVATRAQVTVVGVGGLGEITAYALTTPGEYRNGPDVFGQASSTGGGTTSTVTGIGNPPLATSTKHAPGDILTIVNGTPERILGIPQWPHAEVLTVDAAGHILTAQLISVDGIPAGGSFTDMSSSGFLDMLDSTGLGTSARFEVTSFDAERATFKDAVYDPVIVRIARAGVYSVAPVGTLAHGVSTNGGVGAGATFTAVYGPIVDASHSPRRKILVPNSGSATIEGFGPRQGVEYDVIFAGAKTLVASATLVLPLGANVDARAGDSITLWSDKSSPVIYTMSNYTRADGTPLRDYIIDQGAPAAYTNGATLVGADIRAGIIEVNAADSLADNYQLPTGADMSAAFPEVATGKAVEFSILNLNANAAADATITTNTNWTLRGNMVIESNDADRARSSATFRARKTAGSSWTLYRK